MSELVVEGIAIAVHRKSVRNLRLTVHPQTGEVRISAPRWVSLAAVSAFAESKLEWIRRHRLRAEARPLALQPAYRSGELHEVWGARCPLQLHEVEQRPAVLWEDGLLVLRARPGSSVSSRRTLLDAWYREQVANAAPPLVALWESRLEVKAARLAVRRMRTRWGSCTPRTRHIRLSSELAKKPPECLEYVVVHELVHLLEPTHGARFVAFMNRFLPEWRERRKQLRPEPQL